ncbi:STM4504/CBY_0614 family protein [Pseudomonas umsongensis]|uniref:Abortive infection C-terminus n=1 Tax=Pseudomonas umsongensis TaxID=198618 RepID=A0AAE6ZTB3_9PSED|nr:hypothetical protein [Pseudomonas umsongensis]QJC78218.1 hypothetical protein HGP31_07810 [Pseudomonas umsongensis]
MGLFDLYSKRQKRMRGEVPDVYVYDELPNPLRVQIVHIIRDAVGTDHYNSNAAEEVYEFFCNTLCREYGVFELKKHEGNDSAALFNFFLNERVTEKALDVVELCFKIIDNYVRENQQFRRGTDRKIEADDALDELNARFKEHGVGYQFESGEIIRVDSKYLHAEAVKPTLEVLRGAQFEGANEEFLQAHEDYRHGRHKECLVAALKSFESTMIAICTARGWPIKPGETARGLIGVCMANGLFPSYMDAQMGAIKSLLESGVPTVRNKHGGHGQGTTPVAVPEFMARYALNLTATTILFMAEAHAAL